MVSGTPSDCVHLALTGLLDDRPDLVVSGINCGANMGDDTMYSGTVAAAIEGYIFGIDSIAFSQIDKGWAELPSAAAMAGKIVERFLARREKNPADPILLNVNMPNLPLHAMQGIRTTRLGRRHNAERMIDEINPRGMPIYWLGAAGKPRKRKRRHRFLGYTARLCIRDAASDRPHEPQTDRRGACACRR